MLYFTIPGPAWLTITTTVAFAWAMLVSLWFRRHASGQLGATCLLAAIIVWWFSLVPSNHRDWKPEYARTATVQQQGDRVAFTNIRNTVYDGNGGQQITYYDASFQPADLDEVDLISSHWSSDAIAHVFLSFGFKDGRHLAISVETRQERGEAYSVLGGFFRRYEIIYVAADERDLIGVRTDIRRESLYLYRLVVKPAEMRRFFMSYVERIESLSAVPEFYNTLTNNCTTNVLARANAVAVNRIADSWMVLVSGYDDQYAYQLGRLDQSLPFAELKRCSLVHRPSGAHISDDFSSAIRSELPHSSFAPGSL